MPAGETIEARSTHCCYYVECIERSGRGHCWCEDECEITSKEI